jgi:peptidoglycan/xylan/chitin deacetylase (PgdA/CDA1 family)
MCSVRKAAAADLPDTLHRLASALLATAALLVTPAAAGEEAHPGICWDAAALSARKGEEAIVKGDRRFDRATPWRILAPHAPVLTPARGVVRRVSLPEGRKLIALTFDLCEQTGEVAGYDGGIVDYLRANAIRATFFAGGKWLRSHAERARQLIADPLFEIANHSEAHRNLRLMSGVALAEEIAGPERAYETLREELAGATCFRASPGRIDAVPARMSLFRFPFGACNAASLAAVSEAGLVAVQWDLSTGDPSPAQSAAAVADAMVRRARPGSIIVAHANGRGYHTSAALPLAIPRLKAQGFEFVTVSELLAAGTLVLAPSCYDSHPGDTDRYDHLIASYRRGKEK